MTKAQTTVISYADMAVTVATHALAHDTAKEAAAKALADANALIVKMHKAGVKIGNNNKCAIATAFHSTLVQGKKAKGTANNYLSEFRKAVESGKELKGWNSAQDKAKAGKAKGKGKGKAELAGLLLKAFNHADFAEACGIIEAEYLDDKGTIHAIIKSYLEALGCEFKAA
jgi:hypothetical protein